MSDNKTTRNYIYRVSIVASLGGLLFGYDTAVIAGAIGFLQTKFDLTPAMTGCLEVPSKCGDDYMSFTVDAFFPNLEDITSSSGELAALLQFLYPVGISDEQLASLSACQHQIDKGKRSSWKDWDKVVKTLHEARNYALQAGDLGHAPAALLQDGITSGDVAQAIECAVQAYAAIDAQRRHLPLHWVRRMCARLGGKLEGSENAELPCFSIGAFDFFNRHRSGLGTLWCGVVMLIAHWPCLQQRSA